MFSHEAIEHFLNSLNENGSSSETVRAYGSDLKGLLTWMETSWVPKMPSQDTSPESLTKVYLNLHKETWAPRTLKRKAACIKAFAKFIGESGFLADYRLPNPGRAIPHPIPEGVSGVLDMLYLCTNSEQQCLVALCGLMGLRVSEARSVHSGSFNLVDETLTVEGKGNKTRTLPVTAAAWKWIEPAYLDAITIEYRVPLINYSDRGARVLIARLGRKASLMRAISSHDLRATFATAAYNKSRDLRVVQELMGHSSSQTTEVYTGVVMEKMREAAEIA